MGEGRVLALVAADGAAPFCRVRRCWRSGLAYAIRPGIKGVHLWTGYFTISFKDVSVG